MIIVIYQKSQNKRICKPRITNLYFQSLEYIKKAYTQGENSDMLT